MGAPQHWRGLAAENFGAWSSRMQERVLHESGLPEGVRVQVVRQVLQFAVTRRVQEAPALGGGEILVRRARVM